MKGFISHRNFNMTVRILFIATISILIASCKERVTEKKPNIIYIMADDLGIGDLGCYGQEIIKTPNLDKLAEEGIRFTQHYAGNTVCAPSRCALMTGKHMGHAEVRGNKQAPNHGQWPITNETVTVAELLKTAGYRTAMIGKWGLGNQDTPGAPLKQGFDYYFGYLDQVLAHNYYPEYLLRNDEKVVLDNKVFYLPEDHWTRGLGGYAENKVEYSHDLFTTDALQYIEENQDQPFFLYIPYTIPHNNGEALENEKQEVPDFGLYENEDWPKERKGYAAMISRMDRDIGIIMKKLSDLEMLENTLVIFTSDNGPMPDVEFTEYFNSNTNYRGGKRFLYEGGIRVPMIASWKGRTPAGSQSDHISAFWDFLPTVCEVTGIPIPDYIDGISFLPSLLDRKDQQKLHDYLYWEFPEKGYSVAARKGKWKAIRTNMNDEPEKPLELYNLDLDPEESQNIAENYPEIVSMMKEILRDAHTRSDNFPMPGE
ncbi:arylsulfatase [Bacteroidota bacterium]